MRLLAYNIQGCARGLERVGGAIREIAPDVACLTEVRRGHMDGLTKIIGRAGVMVRVTRFAGFGNAIFARERPIVVRRVRFSKSPGLVPRAMLLARAGDVLIACVHLGLTGEERTKHARELLDALPHDGPLVVAGDFNEGPSEPAVTLIRSAGLVDAHVVAGDGDGATFPSTTPDRRIDYVLVRDIGVTSCEVPETLASDHRPVLADLA